MPHVVQTVLHHIPGACNNLTEQELSMLFGLLQKQRLAKTVFYDGITASEQNFVDMMKEENQWLYVFCATPHTMPFGICNNSKRHNDTPLRRMAKDIPCIRGYIPLAFCWLNNFTGKTAMIHFAVFAHAFCCAKEIGDFAVRMLLFARPLQPAPIAVCANNNAGLMANVIKENPETFCLDALYGATPSCFRHALYFVQKLGFTVVGKLPYAAIVMHNNKPRCTSTTITTLTRNGLLASK